MSVVNFGDALRHINDNHRIFFCLWLFCMLVYIVLYHTYQTPDKQPQPSEEQSHWGWIHLCGHLMLCKNLSGKTYQFIHQYIWNSTVYFVNHQLSCLSNSATCGYCLLLCCYSMAAHYMWLESTSPAPNHVDKECAPKGLQFKWSESK